MKRHFLTLILAAFFISTAYGCGAPPKPQLTGDPDTDTEVDDQPDDQPGQSNEPPKTEAQRACEKEPSKEGCACILDPRSTLCYCTKHPKNPGCLCVLHKDDPECICTEQPNSLACYCKQNPDSERCKPPTDYDQCERYCAFHNANATIPDALKEAVANVDCDHDGLTTKEETDRDDPSERTDPCDDDTDHDGVNDGAEAKNSTSGAGGDDTDQDGVSDKREKELDLDPTNKKTGNLSNPYGNNDGDLWIISACDVALRKLQSVHSEPLKSTVKADWQLLLPKDTKGEVVNPTAASGWGVARRSAVSLTSPSLGIYGGVISDKASVGWNDVNSIDNIINKLGSKILYPIVLSSSQAHDGSRFSTANAVIQAQGRGIAEVRKKFFFELAKYMVSPSTTPISESDVTFPTSDTDETAKQYYIKITTVFRTSEKTDGSEIITMFAITPYERFKTDDLIQMRVDDLTNTSNLSQLGNEVTRVCVEMRTDGKKRGANFYFVLDESGSMNTANKQMKAFAGDFYKKLNQEDLAWQVGVTNICPSNTALNPDVGVVFGWRTKDNDKSGGDFENDVARIIKDKVCGDEQGLRVAQDGLNKMYRNRTVVPEKQIPADNLILTIWVTDESDSGWATNKRVFIQNKINFFQPITTGYALVTEPTKAGDGYVEVAQATGGAYATLYDNDNPNSGQTIGGYKRIIDQIVDRAAAESSLNLLPSYAISSTLIMYRDASVADKTADTFDVKGELVPRSNNNGFRYNAANNTVSFKGKYIPEAVKEGQRGLDFIVIYDFFNKKEKNF